MHPLRKRGSLVAAAPALILAAATCHRSGSEAIESVPRPSEPNILVMIVDDLGYGDLGFQGGPVPSPALDRLARQGVRFTSAYVTHPFCSPTRAALLTGRYQQRFGHEYNPCFDPTDLTAGLPAGEPTLFDVLRGAGYATGAIGKWHLGAAAPFHPNVRGTDEFYGFLGGAHDYFHYGAGDSESRGPLLRDDQPVGDRGYLTDLIGREAERFIERHRADAFFLYVAFSAPHLPLQATAADRKAFSDVLDPRRRTYYGMLRALDRAVGRVLGALDRHGLTQDTLVFFLNDNGAPAMTPGTNAPLRGSKGDLFDGGVRVPMLLSWPGRVPEGVEYAPAVSSLDVFATAVGAAGTVPLDPPEGVNLLPFVRGEREGAPHAALFWRASGGQTFGVLSESSKYIFQWVGEKREYLFDLAEDPAESLNLIQQRPDEAQRLRRLYEEWNGSNRAPAFDGC